MKQMLPMAWSDCVSSAKFRVIRGSSFPSYFIRLNSYERNNFGLEPTNLLYSLRSCCNRGQPVEPQLIERRPPNTDKMIRRSITVTV